MDYTTKGIKRRQRELKLWRPRLFRLFIANFYIGLFVLFIALGVVGTSFGMGLYRGILQSTPRTNIAAIRPAGLSTFIYDCEGNKISKLVTSDSNRIYTNIDKIPVDVQHAFVAIEDRRFYEHKGIDPVGILRALVVGLQTHDFSQGASTITQQLLKNNVFTDWTEEHGLAKWKRKVQEQFLAQQLESSGKVTKNDILELYLNTINLGAGTLGIQAASQRYFDKDSNELTLSEGAVLAAIPQNPTKYNPITHPEDNAQRRKKVLGDMLEDKWIDEKAYQEALNDDVYKRIKEVNKVKEVPIVNSYFIDALVEQLMDDLQTKAGMTQQQAYYQLYSGGLQIFSTQDPKIQKVCDDYVNNPENFGTSKYSIDMALTVTDVSGNSVNLSHYSMLANLGLKSNLFDSREKATEAINEYKLNLRKEGYTDFQERVNIVPQPQLSAVIIDQNTGEVKGIIGGRGPKTESLTFNRATDSTRQPGSTFKVLATYLPAFDTNQKTLASTQVDAAYNYINGTPVHNYYSGYRGVCTLRYGIEQSLNIVTVKTLTDITPTVGFDYLQRMGFTTLINEEMKDGKTYTDIQQSLALGGITYGVKNIELCAAYAAIANYGKYNKPTFYTVVKDKDGHVILRNDPPQQIFKPATAYECISAMEDVITKGTGKVCQFPGQDLAGKTGTTSNNKDVWFAGFSPYYTCVTWAGYDGNYILHTSTDRALAKNAWHDIMEEIHKDLTYKSFECPEDIQIAEICTSTGKLATDECRAYADTTIEYFDVNNFPNDECPESHHVRQPVSENSNSSISEELTAEQQQMLMALYLQQQALLQAQQAQQAQIPTGDPNAPQQ